jgi:hypothetical protein
MSVDTILFYLTTIIGLVLVAVFGFMGLRMWFSLRQDEELKKTVVGNKIALSKIKGKLNKIMDGELPAGNEQTLGLDLNNLTLEGAAEMIGIDPKELNNPIIRPLAEKIFNNLKNRNVNVENPPDENVGY